MENEENLSSSSTLTEYNISKISQEQKFTREKKEREDQHVPLPMQQEIYTMGKHNLIYLRIVFYVTAFVDLFLLFFLFLTLFVWLTDFYDIPNIYLFLYLTHLPHLFSSFGLIGILFDSINFYYMNMIAVIYGIATLFDFIAFVWRSVCISFLSGGGGSGCPDLIYGKWLAWTTFSITTLFFFTSLATFISLIFYIRGMKFHLNNYFNWLLSFQKQQASKFQNNRETISFQQPYEIYMARLQLRSFAGADLFLFAIIVIIRILFFFGDGFWYSPFIQSCHIFLWLWILELAGSNEYKVPVNTGGTDASTNGTLAFITFYIFVVVTCGDLVCFILNIIEMIQTLLSLSFIEFIIGWFLFALSLALLFYDIYILLALSKLTNQLEKYVSAKIK